ncbi:helix-turn-helix domain-containing protein [Streptomyces noursei]|uniref:helix-turn-helix domain-containing protein n=1 Tax=Streptomyces noursei TaxID=1971 RepID=UPI001675EB05|nr:helix-turn-helix domain-containing protein [Streptomyces noursei]MCZ1016270.1 helix-turn-helix domain-containing protein [Streptomyces noursei]GGX00924.1 DNA-binding protein [Streptomyces noursei]
MALKNPSAPSRTVSRVPATTPSSGVIHANSRHTSHFTVVGNHLAQHRGLTLVAIGLALHIQSLPAGARIGIKCLTARFPESEARIASALRELEAAGYLKRTRERLPSGRVVTRTVSYNKPGAAAHPVPRPAQRAPRPTREHAAKPTPKPAPAPAPAAAPAAAPAPAPAPQAKPARAPLPAPRHPSPDGTRLAHRILVELRRDDPRLLLSEADVARLAPAVSAWLEREAPPDAVRRTLSANLPDGLRNPAALLAHRLTALLPPPLPAAAPAPARPDPFQTCDGCERAFRAPEPGLCHDCLRVCTIG